MRRGEVRIVDFDPARPSEVAKSRPAIVVSNDGANAVAERLGRGTVTVVPISSNVTRTYDFQVALPAGQSGLHVASKAQAEQVRAVSIARVGPAVGRLPLSALTQLDAALRLHLAL